MAPIESKPIRHDTDYGEFHAYVSGEKVIVRLTVSALYLAAVKWKMEHMHSHRDWALTETRKYMGDVEVIAVTVKENPMTRSYTYFGEFRRKAAPEPVVLGHRRKISFGGGKPNGE